MRPHTIAKILPLASALFVLLHGLIHLMGAAVYWQLAEIEGLPYKTSILNGRWDLGEAGIQWFGGLWALCALGFTLATVGFLLSPRGWWRFAMLAAAVLSLLIVLLDWPAAAAGIAVNLMILGGLWLLRPAGSYVPAIRRVA